MIYITPAQLHLTCVQHQYRTLQQATCLHDIVAWHVISTEKTFVLVYILYSTVTHQYYRFCLSPEIYEQNKNLKNPLYRLTSLKTLYPNADWLERETWDLLGIFFHGHENLRRILTDYGFYGHPLKRDFPVTGFYTTLYSDRKKQLLRCAYDQMIQEYRQFTFESLWNTSQPTLEKRSYRTLTQANRFQISTGYQSPFVQNWYTYKLRLTSLLPFYSYAREWLRAHRVQLITFYYDVLTMSNSKDITTGYKKESMLPPFKLLQNTHRLRNHWNFRIMSRTQTWIRSWRSTVYQYRKFYLVVVR